MVSRKIECASCNKKCSGNVLRYQDQYYHKQCFESEQKSVAGEKVSQIQQQPQYSLDETGDYHSNQQQQQQIINNNNNSNKLTSTLNNQMRQSSKIKSSKFFSKTTTTTTTTTTTPPPQSSSLSIPNMNQNEPQNQNGRSSADQRRNRTPYHQEQQHRSNDRKLPKSATLPHPHPSSTSTSVPNTNKNGFADSAASRAPGGTLNNELQQQKQPFTNCAGCKQIIKDSEALKALDKHWHVWCFKCTQCKSLLHGEYVAKDGKPFCEKDYQKLFGVTCVYCKRYITGKVLQAGEAHHFHPSCARCSKCGDPFVPGEEMYLQGEITWHPRCGPGPDSNLAEDLALNELSGRNSQLHGLRAHSPSLYSSRSRSRSVSPFSLMSPQYARSSPIYADSEAVGDLSRVYTISYLNADPSQGYLRRPIEPNPPKSPQFSRPVSLSTRAGGGDRSRSSSRSHQTRDRSAPRTGGMYSILSSIRSSGGAGGGSRSSARPKSPSMLNEEAIHLSHYPAAQKPAPNELAKIERDDFPAPPFPYTAEQRPSSRAGDQSSASARLTRSKSHDRQQHAAFHHQPQHLQPPRQVSTRASRPRSRELPPLTATDDDDQEDDHDQDSSEEDPRLRKEEKELSKIASGIGKIFLQTLKEREKLRAWKKSNLDPRNASRTPSATRELSSRLRYENPRNASPSRDMQRPRVWDDDDEVAGTTAGDHSPARSAKASAASSAYGYKVVPSVRSTPRPGYGLAAPSHNQQYLAPGAATPASSYLNGNRSAIDLHHHPNHHSQPPVFRSPTSEFGRMSSPFNAAHLRRSMPNVNNLNNAPPELYPYHLLVTSNYRLPPDVDRCHLERHLAADEFQCIFHCDRLDFYRLPEWRRNELKRRARLF